MSAEKNSAALDAFVLQRRRADGGTAVLGNWGFRNETDPLTDVLLGPADHLRHMATSSLSRKTLREHPGGYPGRQSAASGTAERLCALRRARSTGTCAEPELPMQVYARDSSVMTPVRRHHHGDGQLVAPRREFAAIRTYERLGIPIYDMVTAGTFEGGDFNVIEEGCVLIGCGGGRTQEEGARQVESWFKKEGWETRLAFFDEYYVHIDLMVVPIAPQAHRRVPRLHRTRHRRVAQSQGP